MNLLNRKVGYIMSKENLEIGLNYFEELEIETMEIQCLLNVYGKLKVLELNAFSEKHSDIAYKAQGIMDKIENKIVGMIRK